jgi:DNA-binding CsgD family transcriptional regulator
LEGERFGGLMAHDREAAALIAQDKSNHEIAETMIGNAKTMETYLMCILNKLDFDTQF